MQQQHPHARAVRDKHSRGRLVERIDWAEVDENKRIRQSMSAAAAATRTGGTGAVGTPLVNTRVSPSPNTNTAAATTKTTATLVTTPIKQATTTTATTNRVVPTPHDETVVTQTTVAKPKPQSSGHAASAVSQSSAPYGNRITQAGPVSSTGNRGLITATGSANARLSGTAAAAEGGESSSSMSGGAVAGIVIAVLLGVTAAAALAMYFRKKAKGRNYNKGNGWSKMDDDVTPFPSNSEKAAGGYYGASPSARAGAGAGAAFGGAAAAGGMHSADNLSRDLGGMHSANSSSRGLAVQNSFYADGRPQSEMVGENFAGYGAGRVHNTNGASPITPIASYPIQPQGGYSDNQYSPSQVVPAPYHTNSDDYHDQYGMPQQQQQNAQYSPFDDPAYSPTHDSSAPRQLVGPGQQYQAYCDQAYGMDLGGPVPLGRPEAPNSYDDIAAAEMYADDRYADDHLAAPALAPVDKHIDSDPTYIPHNQRLSPAPEGDHELPDELLTEKYLYEQDLAQQDFSQDAPAPVPARKSPSDTIPQLAPMSPFLNPMSLNGNNTAPPAAPASATDSMDEETARMYGEVAAAAGIPVGGAQPYQHGQPLAPVREVNTPLSDARPLPSTPGTPTRHPLPATPTPPPGAPMRLPPASSLPSDDAYGGM